MAGGSVLHGELGLLSLFDLGQLLMLNRASGELTVTSEGRRGYFYFDAGMIVNAVDDEYHEGEGAAYRLFTWKHGAFDFMPGPASGARTIEDNTEGLMMEAARRMDEAGAEGGGEVNRLTARASSLEALREAFQFVAREATGQGGLGGGGGDSPFELLRDPADALLLRPGLPPRLRAHGRWRTLDTAALDPLAYEAMRARLLEGSSAAPDASPTHVVTLDGGLRCAVTRIDGEHEALWVRAAALAPQGAAWLDGERVMLDAMLARPAGLLLVAGPDAPTAERLFHACIARWAETRGGTLLLAADHERWSHVDRAGAVLQAGAADAVALARDTAPDVVAFDLAHAPLAADVLATVPRVIAAVVSPDAAGALARWCSLAGRRWGDGIEVPLGNAPVEVVIAPQPAGLDGRLVFATARLSLGAAVAAADPDGPENTTDDALETAPTTEVAAAAPEPEPPAAPAAEADEPEPSTPPKDAMAALAAELTRTLRKVA